MLISTIYHQVTSQNHFDNLFSDIELPWKKNYLTAHKVAANRHLRRFSFKIINNVLYLNKKLFQFGKIQSPLCSFCHTKSQTTLHVFHKCLVSNFFWNQLFWNRSWLSWFNTAESIFKLEINRLNNYCLIYRCMLKGIA